MTAAAVSPPPRPACGERSDRIEDAIRVRGTLRILTASEFVEAAPHPDPLPAKSGARENRERHFAAASTSAGSKHNVRFNCQTAEEQTPLAPRRNHVRAMPIVSPPRDRGRREDRVPVAANGPTHQRRVFASGGIGPGCGPAPSQKPQIGSGTFVGRSYEPVVGQFSCSGLGQWNLSRSRRIFASWRQLSGAIAAPSTDALRKSS